MMLELLWLTVWLLLVTYHADALSSRAPPPSPRRSPRTPRSTRRGPPRPSPRGPPPVDQPTSTDNNEIGGRIKKMYDSMFFFGLDIPDVPESQRKRRRRTNRKPGGFSPFFTESEKDAQDLFFDDNEIMRVEATQEDKIRRRMDEKRQTPQRPASASPSSTSTMSIKDQLNRIDDKLVAFNQELELLEVEIVEMQADESRDGMDDRDLLRAQRRKESILQAIEDLQIEYITLSSS